MKITKSQLKQIVQEELTKSLKESFYAEIEPPERREKLIKIAHDFYDLNPEDKDLVMGMIEQLQDMDRSPLTSRLPKEEEF